MADLATTLQSALEQVDKLLENEAESNSSLQTVRSRLEEAAGALERYQETPNDAPKEEE